MAGCAMGISLSLSHVAFLALPLLSLVLVHRESSTNTLDRQQLSHLANLLSYSVQLHILLIEHAGTVTL